MGIPAGVTRWVLRGHLTGGEIFETGFWTPTVFADGPTANAGCVTAAANFITDLYPTVKPWITADSGYDEVRSYSYPAGGPAAAVIGTGAIAGGVGTAPTGNVPLQTAMCVTLNSDLAGRKHRGRMYFPFNAGSLGNHQFQAADLTAMALAVANFLQRFAPPDSPVIVSQVGAGGTTKITAVTVDSKPDVQRRRAARLVPASKATHVVAH